MFEEHEQSQNELLLQEVAQDTELGKNTLDELLGLSEDRALKHEMLNQQREYRRLNQQAHTALAALGVQAKGQSAMAKMNVSMGIRTRTLRDKSTRNLAQMLAEGSNQGVLKCLQAQHDCPKASAGAKQLARQLQQFQQQSEDKWKEFL